MRHYMCQYNQAPLKEGFTFTGRLTEGWRPPRQRETAQPGAYS